MRRSMGIVLCTIFGVALSLGAASAQQGVGGQVPQAPADPGTPGVVPQAPAAPGTPGVVPQPPAGPGAPGVVPQPPAGPGAPGVVPQKALDDRAFVQMAAQANLAEINLGNLALKKAASPEVKEFAQKMIQDHTMANKKLLDLANKLNLALAAATTMDPKHQMLAKKLMALQGAEFDRAYMDAMVKDHQEAIALVEAQAKGGEREELRQFAAQALPHLQEHLQLAQQVQQNLQQGGAGGQKGGGQEPVPPPGKKGV